MKNYARDLLLNVGCCFPQQYYTAKEMTEMVSHTRIHMNNNSSAR